MAKAGPHATWPSFEARKKERAPQDDVVYLAALHSLVTSAISAFSGSLIADGVREKRGAGAGWVTP